MDNIEPTQTGEGKIKKTFVQRYIGFWSVMNQLSDATEELAVVAIVKAIKSFNQLFTTTVSQLLPLLSPAPAAANMARVLIDKHDRPVAEGIILAIILDLLGFALTERSVEWWFDDDEEDVKRYAGLILTGAFYTLLLVTVYKLEGIGVGIIFPILSIISSCFYALMQHSKNKPSRRVKKSPSGIRPKAPIKPAVAPPVVPDGFLGEGTISDDEIVFMGSLSSRSCEKYKMLFEVLRGNNVSSAKEFSELVDLGQTTAYNLFREASESNVIILKDGLYQVKFDG